MMTTSTTAAQSGFPKTQSDRLGQDFTNLLQECGTNPHPASFMAGLTGPKRMMFEAGLRAMLQSGDDSMDMETSVMDDDGRGFTLRKARDL